MEKFESAPSPAPKENPEEQKQQEYREAVKAAELIWEVSLRRPMEGQTLSDYENAFSSHLAHLEDRLTSDEGDHFFEVLPTLNKLSRIHENVYDSPGLKRIFEYALKEMVSNEAIEALYRGMKVINEKTLTLLDPDKIKDLFESIKLLLTCDRDHIIQEAVDFLERNEELLKKISEDKQLPEIENELAKLRDFLQTKDFDKVVTNAIAESPKVHRDDEQRKEQKPYESLLRKMLSKYGFDPDDILGVWCEQKTDSRWPQIESMVKQNMEKVFEIEGEREGIAKLLYKEFGIRNFERYPKAILIAQYDEFDNLEKPYGVLIEATHDWNGAFSAWSKKGVWDEMFEQIKDQYALRIAEARSKQEVARRLIKLNQKYGAHHKISFAFIGGHGSKNSIEFGGMSRRNILFSEDLTGRGAHKVSNFFEPHPTIVLVSCSTGVEGGIGQELSKTLGAKVIAPSVPTNLEDIDAILSDDGIDFKVEYGKQGGGDIREVYSSGERKEN